MCLKMLTRLWGGNEDIITPVPPQMYLVALKVTQSAVPDMYGYWSSTSGKYSKHRTCILCCSVI